MSTFSLIYSTFANKEDAEKAATHLLQKRLIGCAVFLPAHSMYWWKGAIESSPEVLLLAKTTRAKSVKARAELAKIHPYETPCILEWAAEPNASYLNWLMGEVRETKKPTQKKKK